MRISIEHLNFVLYDESVSRTRAVGVTWPPLGDAVVNAMPIAVLYLALIIVVAPHAFAQQATVDHDEAVATECSPPAGTLPFDFEAGGNRLRGYIDLPSSPGPSPVILMVNGSLPTDVMQGGSIAGRQRLSREGIAYVSWDNPGSGCSEGVTERVPDLYRRVDELLAAVEELKARDDIDASRIGALGLSQGGWVLAMAAARSEDLAFLIILSGPARDMIRQATYLVRTNLILEGYSLDESTALARQYEQSQTMALAGATHEEYLAAIEAFIDHPFFEKLDRLGGSLSSTPEEYSELQTSQSMLVSADTFLSSVTVPVLAIYGQKDSWVDWREGARIFREAFARGGNQDLTVRILDNTSHNMCLVETGSLEEFLRMEPCEQPEEFGETLTTWLQEHGFAGP